MSKIFLSGPMFSPADLWEQDQIDKVCVAAGHATYLASRDGIEDDRLIQGLKNPLIEATSFQKLALMVQKLGWAHDCWQLMSSDAVVFNMNGRVPDEGSVNEASMAYAAGIPVVTYKETSITMWGPFDNPMVAALTHGWEPVTSKPAIAPALEAALQRRSGFTYTYAAPPPFQEALELGHLIAEHRDEVMKILTGIEKATSPGAMIKEIEHLAEGAERSVARGIDWLRRHIGL